MALEQKITQPIDIGISFVRSVSGDHIANGISESTDKGIKVSGKLETVYNKVLTEAISANPWPGMFTLAPNHPPVVMVFPTENEIMNSVVCSRNSVVKNNTDEIVLLRTLNPDGVRMGVKFMALGVGGASEDFIDYNFCIRNVITKKTSPVKSILADGSKPPFSRIEKEVTLKCNIQSYPCIEYLVTCLAPEHPGMPCIQNTYQKQLKPRKLW